MALPTVILPGYLAGASAYRDMEDTLIEAGFPTVTVPLKRRDWFPTVGGRSMTPIVAQLDQTIQNLLQDSGASQVNLVGHSAGGWIARIYLGEQSYDVHQSDLDHPNCWAAHPAVANLITLGTPHVSQEQWTRRNLNFVNNNYPGAFYNTVRYICVAGKAIYGKRDLKNWFTYNSYLLTAGRGDCWGDGITPIEAAHLVGAENILLEGVHHSPKPGLIWYGSEIAMLKWMSFLG